MMANSGSARRPDWPGTFSAAVLALGTIAIYCRTFSVPFLFDDASSITNNPSIRHWSWSVLAPPNNVGVGGRPLFNLSFALNYAFGGTHVFGYHLVNLAIHVLVAWTLFALVRRTLRRPVLEGRFGSSATILSLSIAALWAWHPVQTESVTYVTQRCESLMGLFYLLTLYCLVRSAETLGHAGRVGWSALCVLSCLAGVGTKEVTATAPVLALLYDRTFLAGSFSRAWRNRWPLYLLLAATWIPLAWLLHGLHQRGIGFDMGISWWAYGLNECRVVVKYLLLAIWPYSLVFDRGLFAPMRMTELLPYVLVLAALVAATVVALRRWPVWGFAAAWFFLILAPTSSIAPLASQPMADHRLYLPLASVVALIVLATFAWLGRRLLPAFLLMGVGLGATTFQRNRDYASDLAIWTDTVAKCPSNTRAHNNLGVAWSTRPGHLRDAIAQYQEALRLNPKNADAHVSLGNAWMHLPGHVRDAIAEYQEALRLKPDYAEAHAGLGSAWSKTSGHLGDAIAEYRAALRLNPADAEAHNGLGSAWSQTPGRLDAAIAEFQEALRLKPDYVDAHNNLGNALSQIPGRLNDAIAQYREALRLNPGDAETHDNLGSALADLPGRQDEAIAEYQEALRLKPDDADSRNNLGIVLFQTPGRQAEGIAEYREALRLKPDDADAHFNLAVALLSVGGSDTEAAAHLKACLRVQPDNDRARQMLENIQRQHTP